MSTPQRGKATTVSLYAAKTHLSELGERAAGGEEITVTKHGKARFRIVALEPQHGRRKPGRNLLGVSYVSDDFDAPVPEIEKFLV